MRAAWYERNGPAAEVLRLGKMPEAAPGAGEVMVRVRVSAVNPSDVKSRAGTSRRIAFPRVIPHQDGAGVIERVGPGIPRERVGERVWTYEGTWQRAFGTAAETVTLPARQAVPLPDHVDFDVGACLGIPAMTAHRCLFADGPVAGMTVLVTGGAGVVGNAAIQLAKWAGARVVATASSPAKAAMATRAGADAVIDYRAEDVAVRLLELTGGVGVDRAVDVDFGANLPVTARAVRPNGAVASYGSTAVPRPEFPYYEVAARNVLFRPINVYSMPPAAKEAALRDIALWLAAGTPIVAIAGRFPLEGIVEAHHAVERTAAKVGQVLIDLT